MNLQECFHLPFQTSVHSNHLLAQLAGLRDDSQLCDVVLLVKGTRINAHRVVLAACSKYFKAMFSNINMSQGLSQESLAVIDVEGNVMADSRSQSLISSPSFSNEIEMVDLEASALVALVHFFYTGRLEIDRVNVLGILHAASVLHLDKVQDSCSVFLKNELDPTNCLAIRSLAEKYACQDLLRSADKFILHNFQEVVGSEEFCLLPVDQLVRIISSEELQVKSEEQVFTAVAHWVRFNSAERKNHFSKLLEHVRLPLCSPKFLVNTVSEDPLLNADATCRELVNEAKNHLLLQLSTLERSKLHGPRIRPRKVLFGEVLYAVGGWSNSVERMDPGEANPVWQAVAPMAKRRHEVFFRKVFAYSPEEVCRGGVEVAVLDNVLYAVGGKDGSTYLDINERYDPSTNRWLCNVAPTCSARDSFGLVALDGSLYAVGGRYNDSSLNVVERYDVRRNEWIYVAPMLARRHGVSVAVLNGCLYAVGGADGKLVLNTVERLDPRVGNWEPIPPMSTCRHHEGSAVLDGYLYVAGGHDGSSPLNSAEKYNPITNEWTEVAAMSSKRHGVRLAVVNGKIYAVGGNDDAINLGSVEVFDQETNQWSQHSSMKEPQFEPGLGVIRMP